MEASFDDFLVPALPGLTYESHSEQSHSPRSNHDTSAPLESDWLNWEARGDEVSFHVDPLFPVDGEDLFLKSPTDAHVPQSNVEPVCSALTNDLTMNLITPDMLLGATSVTMSRTICEHASDFPSSGVKRKLGDAYEETAEHVSQHEQETDSTDSSTQSPKNDVPVSKRQNSNTGRPPKISHNVIEKRYRSNLNEKILDLRDTVPSLRLEAEASVKHPKGRIIQGASEYIRELETKCARLQEENNRLTVKLHGDTRPKSGGPLAKIVVGGLAGMMCLSGNHGDSTLPPSHTKRGVNYEQLVSDSVAAHVVQNIMAILKMILLVAAILYIFNPDMFATKSQKTRGRQNEKYSQSALDDMTQEDIQENREAMHDNVSAMLEMPRDRPGLFKRILQGCFVLFLEILIGQSGWNVLINRGLDYALTRQNACKTLIETQLLGGDKCVNQAKLFLSAIQSLGYTMPKEMRAIHFAMVCHGYAPSSVIRWCVSLFWCKPLESSPQILHLPLDQLLSARVLEAFWAWTTGIEDPLISNVRSDETIDTPLRQLSAIHAAMLQNQILREWLRGSETTSVLDTKMRTLVAYSPANSKIMTNSLYLRSMIEPNDWLEKAMLGSMPAHVSSGRQASVHDVAMQLRCCVLLSLLEKNPKEEEVSDVLQMAEVETSSLLPDYSSRIVANCIAKHRLDDDDGISEALRRICAKIGGSTRPSFPPV